MTLNNTAAKTGESPRLLSDVSTLVKGFGREYVYEAEEKEGGFFDPTN